MASDPPARPDRFDLPDEAALAVLVRVLASGGIVAFPTESSYGLAALALSAPAVERLFVLKGRPPDRAVPVVVDSEAGLAMLVAGPLPPRAALLARRHWPGPLSLVLPAAPGVPPLLLAGGQTVAVRVPAHPWARLLCQRAGGPLTATSANVTGQPPALDAEEVRRQLGPELAVLDGGRLPGGPPSTLVEVRGDAVVIHRQGAISLTAEELGHGA